MLGLAAGLVGSFSLLALLLAGLGIFAVVVHLAATRTREIGLRQALGASRASTLGWLLLRATQPVAAGLAVGLVGAASVNRALVGLVPGLRPVDWPALVAAVCGLALVAFAAALPPKLRAVRCDPASALRHE